MSTIDIRTAAADPITAIRFGEPNSNYYIADVVAKRDGGGIELRDSQSARFLRVNTEQHARDCIKALEKAIQLGWLK